MTYEITKEVELSKKDYDTYVRTGKLPHDVETNIEHNLSDDIDDVHFTHCEHYITEIIKK